MTSPILRNVPLQFETERLLIRCPQRGDGATVHSSVVRSLPALRSFPGSLPWTVGEPSVDAWEQFCREGQARYLLRTNLQMLLFLKGAGGHPHIGYCSLFSFDWEVPKCEIGYWGNADFGRARG